MTEISEISLDKWLVGGGEMGAFVRSWFANPANTQSSSLGSVKTWSQCLKTTLNILLNLSYPAFLVWGNDRILFYNDAYFSLLKQYASIIPLGRSIHQVHSEHWMQVRSMIEQVFVTGQPLQCKHQPFPGNQDGHGNLFFTWNYIALNDGSGLVEGVFATGQETASQPTQNQIDKYLHNDRDRHSFDDLKQARTALQQSEARFQAFMSHSPTAAWIVDQSDRILYLSPTYFHMFQLPDQDIVGKFIQDIYAAEFAQRFLENNRQVFETEQVVETNEIAPRPDGSIGSFLVYKFPIYEESTTLLGGVAIDITERDRTEQLLRQREEELRLMTNALPSPIAYVDKAHRYRFNNQAYETWFGQPVTTFIGKHVRDVLGEAAYETVRPYIEQVLSGQRVNFELQMPYQNSKTRYISVNYVPHINHQGETEGFFSLVNDISDRKQAEIALSASEERLRLALAAAQMGTWDVDLLTGKAIWTNHHFTMLGYEPAPAGEASEAMWCERIHPDDRAQVVEEWHRSRQDHRFYRSEYRIMRADNGKISWLAALGNFTYDRTGQAVRSIGVVFDITERKQAEAALHQSEERLRLAQQAANAGLWDWDILTNTVTWSAEYYQLYGLSTDIIPSYQNWLASILEDDRARVDLTIQEALEQQINLTVEFRISHATQGIRWLMAIGQTFYNEENVPIRMTGIALDITRRKQAEVEREHLLARERAAREEAERANRIKDEFLAVLSHELRSPLNPILGWSRLLQQGKLNPAKTQDALATIERNARLQAELIEDLLDVSRILQGKLSLAVNPVNLASIIQAAIETVRLAAEAKSIQINSKLDVVGLVAGDSTRLQQVIWNLLSNAVKFTPVRGRVDVELKLVPYSEAFDDRQWSVHRSTSVVEQPEPAHHSQSLQICSQIANYAQITVSDTGKGIATNFLPYVFDYFRQEDGATTRQFGGLGLGLAIVRHLVELHGGTVDADSPGESLGATFTVRLPLMPTQPLIQSNSLVLKSNRDLQNVKVLIVDDDIDTRDLIAFLLEQAGAIVVSASCAYQAFSVLTQSQFDILISDIGMPDIDGYTLMQHVRSLPPDQGGQIPAIALTAYAGELDHQQAMTVGFQRHITKPVELQLLINTIVELVFPPFIPMTHLSG